MDNPFASPATSTPKTRPTGPRRRMIAVEYLIVGVVSSMVTIALATLVWQLLVGGGPSPGQPKWISLGNLDGMYTLLPFGWMIHSVINPAGWLFWGGGVAAVLTRNRRYLFLAGLAGAIFGLVWPFHCAAMMSV